ncbi:hypothetical protein D3C75_931290 [compost metagenome]
MIFPQEAKVNSFGQIVTRFISTIFLELKDVDRTDNKGMVAIMDQTISIIVTHAVNTFSLLDSNILPQTPIRNLIREFIEGKHQNKPDD